MVWGSQGDAQPFSPGPGYLVCTCSPAPRLTTLREPPEGGRFLPCGRGTWNSWVAAWGQSSKSKHVLRPGAWRLGSSRCECSSAGFTSFGQADRQWNCSVPWCLSLWNARRSQALLVPAELGPGSKWVPHTNDCTLKSDTSSWKSIKSSPSYLLTLTKTPSKWTCRRLWHIYDWEASKCKWQLN